MSYINATVSKIDSFKNLHLVEFRLAKNSIQMISLELDKNLKAGVEVKLLIKPTHINIAKKFSGYISCQNRLDATVVEIKKGKLLSSIKLYSNENILESIITLDALKHLNIRVGDMVNIFINSSEISISEIFYE